MKHITYIIVDDEPLIHEMLEEYLTSYPNLKKLGNFYDAINAQVLLLNNTPDLIFLDIDMGSISGYELLKNMNKETNIIVITAHREFAVEGFELNIIDFILKPITPGRLNKAILKVFEKINKEKEFENLQFKYNFTSDSNSIDYVVLKNKSGQIEKIYFDEILFLTKEDKSNRILITTKDKRELHTLENLKSFRELLPEDSFIRINKSKIVHISFIKCRNRNNIILLDDVIEKIDPLYQKEVNERIPDSNNF